MQTPYSLSRRTSIHTPARSALSAGAAGALLLALAMQGAPAHAQEAVKLKFADWMPVSHYTVTNAAHPFMKKATELSKGKIEFQYFPAEQLGKGARPVLAREHAVRLGSGSSDGRSRRRCGWHRRGGRRRRLAEQGGLPRGLELGGGRRRFFLGLGRVVAKHVG